MNQTQNLSDKNTSLISIEFELPLKRNKMSGETVSKFLNPESELYFFIKDSQDKIKHSGVRITDKLEPCIRILTSVENKGSNATTLFNSRVKCLQHLELDMFDRSKYETINNQLVYNIYYVDKEDTSDNSFKKYSIVIFQLTHKALNKDKYLNIILNPNYSTYTEHEFTGSCD